LFSPKNIKSRISTKEEEALKGRENPNQERKDIHTPFPKS
jgi:hypothetical protein